MCSPIMELISRGRCIIYKSEKKSGQTVQPIQIKTVLVFYQGCLVLIFFVAFTILWTYSVKK